MSFYSDASLIVIPSGYKASKVYSAVPTDGTGDLAFTRSNDTATRVAENGLIEKVRTNQVRNSSMVGAATPNTLPTNWSTQLNGLTREIVGVGTENGLPYIDYKLSGTATGVISTLQFETNSQIIAAQGQLWTHSAYFKLIGGTALPNTFLLSIYEFNSGGSYQSEGSASIKGSITGSLQRFSFTRTLVSTTTARVQPLIQFALTNGATYNFTYRVAAPQMETGDVATNWIATTTAAVSVGPVANTPRINYLGGGCGKLLLEPQRTNLITFSESFDNAGWVKTNTTITANTTISPDGYTNADTILANGASGLHAVQTNAVSYTSGTAASFSIFAKKGTNDFMQLAAPAAVGGMFANFDLNTGVVGTLGTTSGTNPTSSITDYGNGWYRCVINFTPNATSASVSNVAIVSSASAVRVQSNSLATSIILWGCQIETSAAYATSYIPTLAAAVTRGGDACSKTGISSLIGQTEGTIYWDGSVAGTTSTIKRLVSLSDGTTNNAIQVQNAASGRTIQYVIVVGGTQQFVLTVNTAFTFGQQFKLAAAYKANDFVIYINGVQVGSATSGSVPETSKFAFDRGNDTTAHEGDVSQALLFKTRLPNSELASLTNL